MISDRGHQFYAKEFSKQVQNQNFTAALDDLDALRAKGFCGHKQHVNFTAFFFSTIQRHVLQEDQAKPSECTKQYFHRSFDNRNAEGLRKIAFSAVFEDREAFRGKGPTRPKSTLQLHFSF